MKARELIAQLQKYDPEIEVCVDNKDIYFLEPKPAYWDGKLQLLIHDHVKKDKTWSIVGAKVVEDGDKLNIFTMGIEDVIWDMPDLPVDLSNLSHPEEWAQRVAQYREDVKKCLQEIKEKKEKKDAT